MMAIIIITGCDDDDTAKVVLINPGDSYANGVQSDGGNVNKFTQVISYPQIIADQLKHVADLKWGNPLVDMDIKRIDDTFFPYNVGIDTVHSLLFLIPNAIE